MHQITLPRTNITTTRLGFGTAGLMRLASARERINVLAAALDAGIRHFDTAPIYGLGESERTLGQFLRARNERVTITTKFGLMLNPMAQRLQPLQFLGRSLLRAMPGLRRAVRRHAGSLYDKPALTAAMAQSSLRQSLESLGLERVDCLLAHDCNADQFRDPHLLEALTQLQRSGIIGSFGTATSRDHTLTLLNSHPAYCQVVQFPQHLGDRLPQNLPRPQATITHGALRTAFGPLQRSSDMRKRWSDALEIDIENPSALATFLLRCALAANPHGVVLFESTSARHVAHNAAAASMPLDPERLRVAQRLAAALDAHKGKIVMA